MSYFLFRQELHECQLLINDLQNRLKIATNSNDLDKVGKSKLNSKGGELKDIDDILEMDHNACSKCGGINDLEIKLQENNRLKRFNLIFYFYAKSN